jgi:hypothetical protein
MKRPTTILLALLMAACSQSSSSDPENGGETAGALETNQGLAPGEYAACEPVDPSEAIVDADGERFRVTKFTFKENSEDDVVLQVERKNVSGGGALDPIREITPQFVHTPRTLRGAIKRDVTLRAAHSQHSDAYVGTATVHRKSFAVECVLKGPAPTTCRNGASRPDTDGCNTCSCYDGHWGCTELACGNGGGGLPPPPSPPSSCREGDTVQLDCNTCTCTGGHQACTELFCGNR